jgi:spermidine synthase
VYTHGTTIHGVQSTVPEHRHVAGAYYHPTGPAGDVLTRASPLQVGVIGLGVGTLAAYARAGQTYTYLEIDPIVAEIAENTAYFSFLADARSRGADVRVLLGDGRRLLDRARDGQYDVLVLDAYSSDTVPIHLITREAMALYVRKLAPHGMIAMNVSSRYLDLAVVVAALAEQANLKALERLDMLVSAADQKAVRDDGKAVSRWIVLGRTVADLAPITVSGSAWKPLERSASRVWTDDHANILSAMVW